MLLLLAACAADPDSPPADSLPADSLPAVDADGKLAGAPAGPGASCGWAAVQEGVAIQQAYVEAYDHYLDGFASRTDFPLPSRCVGRVEPWVRAVSDEAVEVCGRLTVGADAGRAWCADAYGETYEQAEPVTEVVEPGPGTTADLEAVYADAARRLLYFVDPRHTPPEVTVGEDGRTVALLTGPQTLTCAQQLARELWSAERSYEAAFDTYTPDASAIYAFDLLVSCPAYVAGRVASADETTFIVESVVVEGPVAGNRFVGDESRRVHRTGRVPVSRERLEAEGWWMGEAP